MVLDTVVADQLYGYTFPIESGILYNLDLQAEIQATRPMAVQEYVNLSWAFQIDLNLPTAGTSQPGRYHSDSKLALPVLGWYKILYGEVYMEYHPIWAFYTGSRKYTGIANNGGVVNPGATISVGAITGTLTAVNIGADRPYRGTGFELYIEPPNEGFLRIAVSTGFVANAALNRIIANP